MAEQSKPAIGKETEEKCFWLYGYAVGLTIFSGFCILVAAHWSEDVEQLMVLVGSIGFVGLVMVLVTTALGWVLILRGNRELPKGKPE